MAKCLVAAITPMNLDGSIDYIAFESLLNSFIDNVTGVVVLGTTAESVTILPEERAELLAIASRVLVGIDWYVGVGHASLAQALVYTRAAERFNPTGLMAVTPYYNRPMTDGLIEYFQAIMQASSLPVITYNVPTRTGIDAYTDVWDKLCANKNFFGIKEAHSDVNRIVTLRERYPNLELYTGNDNNVREWQAQGGHGVISVIANAMPKVFMDYCQGADDQRIHALLRSMDQAVNPIAIKCIMHHLGLINLGMRLPLMITNEIYEQVVNSFMEELVC